MTDSTAEFEVACDVLAELIAYATARCDAESRRPKPDQQTLAHWQDRLAHWTARLRGLGPRDAAAVAQVLAEDAPVLAALPMDVS